MKIACLVWATFSDRMDELASEIGGQRKNIQLGYLPRYLAPFKYLIFFGLTQAYLFTERPDVVYAQNPPFFCPLACVPYCRLMGKKLVVDHHNIWSIKVFGGSGLASLFKVLERVLALFADANTAPHNVWRAELEKISARSVITVHDYVEANAFKPSQEVRDQISREGIIGIAAGHQFPLERLEVEILAAESVDGVTLAITGPPAKMTSRISALGPLRHAKYMGYLPKEDYERLKASCDFALNITDEPFTLNHVLFEYVAASLPTISTRREVIEAVFGDSLIYVERSEVGSAAAKIRAFRENPSLMADYRARIIDKFSELTKRREAELIVLKNLIRAK